MGKQGSSKGPDGAANGEETVAIAAPGPVIPARAISEELKNVATSLNPGAEGALEGAHSWENPFGTNGIFARIAEYIPVVNSGIQRLHELTGNEQALTRARAQNPIGPDGYLIQVAEHIPLVNHVVQEVHRTTGEAEAFERARDRNPIGTNGFLTKVVEHIPLVSDGVMAVHKYQGDEVAVERARAHTLQKLLSKDGTITRLAELLPVSNLFAAAMHEVSGNRNEAIRALDLLESWAQALRADGPVAKVAELLPGTDALAFAVHVQGGYYAQAIRSITKTTWVNFEADQVILHWSCVDFKRILAKELEAVNMEIIPRQLSLLVAVSDMLTNFLRIDREGHRRSLRAQLDMQRFDTTRRSTRELTKDLLKAIIDEKVSKRVECFTEEVPAHVQWLIEILNKWIPVWRRRRPMMRLVCPRSIPNVPLSLAEEIQTAFPGVSISAGSFPAVERIRMRRRQRRALLPQVAAASGCLAATGCCGLGLKAAGVGCAAGILAGAVELGRAATRLAMSWIDEWNAECWSDTTQKPQPSDTMSPSAPSEPARSPRSAAPSQSSCAPGAADASSNGAPRGVVLECTEADASHLASMVRSYWFDDALRGGLRACLLRMVEPAIRALVRSVVDTEGQVAPIVIEVETDEWEIEFDSYSFNLRLPSMRFAVILHIGLDGGVPKCRRAFVALPHELVHRVFKCLRDQIQQWDLRELDPRFSGFTKPVHVVFDLDVEWAEEQVMRLTASNVWTRLDLPD